MTKVRSTVALLALAALIAPAPAQRGRGHSSGGGPSRGRMAADRAARDAGGGDRYNPFGGGARPGFGAPRERTTLGVPVREQRFEAYDGRGFARREAFGRAPSRSSLSLAIGAGGAFGGTSVALGGRIGGLRVGFSSYAGPLGRPGFVYPYYAFDPYAPGALVVASPWYGYSFLPPYLDRDRVIVENDVPAWDLSGWRNVDPRGTRIDPSLRDALDDLREAFEGESGRLADRLVPETGNVAIFNEGKYDYSLSPDDFQKMFLDGVEQSKTVRYEILETRVRGDEARVRARHTFTDSFGEEQSVVHRLTLARENGGDYVMREFGTE